MKKWYNRTVEEHLAFLRLGSKQLTEYSTIKPWYVSGKKTRCLRLRIEDFWNFAEKMPDGCWLWRGPILLTGYGQFNVNHTTWRSHRFAWICTFGDIPEDKQICHKCDIRKCICPGHLFLGTQTENMRDMDQKGRSNKSHGEDHCFAKLNDDQVRQMRQLWSYGDMSLAEIGWHFQVDRSLVWQVVSGRTWKHVK